jgi:hypothetical protein
MKYFLLALLAFATSSCNPSSSSDSAPQTNDAPNPPAIPANTLVQNGDFSQGAAHWDGDGLPGHGPGPCLIVPLDPSHWTRVYQTFTPPSGPQQISIIVNYRLSPGLTVSQNAADYAQISKQIGIPGFDNYGSIHVNPGQFYGTVGNPTARTISMEVFDPDYSKVGVIQTYEHTYPPVPGADSDTFGLAFPPGTGTVSLWGIAVNNH